MFLLLPTKVTLLTAGNFFPRPIFLFCLFLQHNYGAPLRLRGYRSRDYITAVAVAAPSSLPSEVVCQCWEMVMIKLPNPGLCDGEG